MRELHIWARVTSSVTVCALLALDPVAWSQIPVPATAPAPAAPATPEFRFPDFNAVTKDMLSVPGLVTLFRYRPDDPTKDHTRLLCLIPRSLLKQDLLLATTFSRGGMAGFMSAHYLVRFEMVGRQVFLNVPDPRFIQTPGRPVTEAVSRTYNEGFLACLPIVTVSPAGDPVVDLGTTLMSTGIVAESAPSRGGGARALAAQTRRELSQFTKVKSFPDNALIEVDLALGGQSGSGQRIGVSYSLRRLPELGSYRPRLADERVGYFTTVRQDWNVKYNERENYIRFINRWDLRKKDPSLDLSPPERPIVFVIEKTVPVQWRKPIADGILEWNRAFERLGIVNAIVVQQQTEDNEFSQIDPEDARYNFFRWVVTGDAFAMGPSRADPRTGQILDADIIFDDSFVRALSRGADILGPKAMSAMFGPEFVHYLACHPELRWPGQSIDPESLSQEPAAELLPPICNLAGSSAIPWVAPAQHPAHARCSYALGLKHLLDFTHLAVNAAAPGSKIPERLIAEMVKDCATHEVGHTLGLRHNFKASSWLSIEEIRRRRDNTDEPTTGSVMDYNAPLYFANDQPDKIRRFVSPTLGPWDFWAIEYGYRIPGKEDGDEKTMLAKIAAQCTRPELAYATDEDTVGLISPDPFANRYDMGNDPIAWAQMRCNLTDSLLKDLRKWAVRPDEPTYHLRSAFATILFEKTRNLVFVSRLVGGQVFSRNRFGDPDARPAFVPVEPQRQRQALALLSDTIFRDEFFAMDPDLLNNLAPSRWWDWASSPSTRIDYPVHQTIASMQANVLLALCSPQNLQRVYDAELKTTGPDRLTAAELICSVRDRVWAGLELAPEARFTDARPMISSIRRNLQRQHLQLLLAVAEADGSSTVSPDIQSMVRYAIRELSYRIGQVLDQAKADGAWRIDFASRAHLTDCRDQIERVLSAPYLRLRGVGASSASDRETPLSR